MQLKGNNTTVRHRLFSRVLGFRFGIWELGMMA
jgi:hypothetical protein